MTDWSPIEAVAPAGVEVAWQTADGPGRGTTVSWSVRNPGRSPVAIDRVGLRLDARPAQVLEHGWQSWSVVRRCRPDDVRPERRGVDQWQRSLYLADGSRAGEELTGDHFLLGSDGIAGFLDGRSHLGVVVASDPAGVTAYALLDGVTLAPGEERRLDPLWVAAGDPGELYSAYCGHWGAAMKARAATPVPLGWCSWYHYFHRISPDTILANLKLAAEHGFGLVQIDDGYQASIGQWLEGREGWGPDGMSHAANAISAAGLTAGIWTAPFIVDEDGPVAAEHPDWLLRSADGGPVRAMYNPVVWGGWAVALDTTHPAVLDHLRSIFSSLRAQGFDYFKIDFCYAAAFPGVRARADWTRAQALRAGLDAVRDGIGDDAFLLGCGLPLGQAVGVVDGMRVSLDVSPFWRPKHELPGLEESALCTRNAIGASLLRTPMHRRLWANDPDCILLRPEQTRLEPWQRRMMATTVAGGGGFALLSDDLALYGDEEWAVVDTLARRAREFDRPLDLVDPFAPSVTVRSDRHELLADWRDDPDASTAPPAPNPADDPVFSTRPPDAGPGSWAVLRHSGRADRSMLR